jgi:hypothetical protein
MANEAAAARDAARYGVGGGSPEQPEQDSPEAGTDRSVLSQAISIVAVNPQEDQATSMRRIVSLAGDPARLEASDIYTPDQKAAIRYAAEIIRKYMNKGRKPNG